MKLIHAPTIGLLLVLLFGAIGCPSAPDEGGRATAVLLITIDGASPDRFSLFGGEVATPTLEELASSGGAWRNAWTVCPMTRPAAATYLTGLAPDRHGVHDDLFDALPEGVDSLAGLLGDAGFRTAAFPDSSFLGASSGLLRGFEVVDDPRGIPINPARWIPIVARTADQTADDFEKWLASVDEGASWMAWVHLSQPLIDRIFRSEVALAELEAEADLREEAGQVKEAERLRLSVNAARNAPDGMVDVDAAVHRMIEVIERRGDASRLLLLVAGTQADPGGGASDLVGQGFSLDQRATRVPVVARFPAGVKPRRGADESVWAPDIPATIAALTGIVLSDEAEGVSLLEPAPDRVLHGWSWALRDQMGWPVLRVARLPGAERMEGYEDPGLTPPVADDLEASAPAPEELRLEAALDNRPVPERVYELPTEAVRAMLESRGLELAKDDRIIEPGPPGWNRAVTSALWSARRAKALNRPRATRLYESVLQRDPRNLAALLDLGQLYALGGRPESVEVLRPAVEKHPWNPEVLHWYAHGIWWQESWEEAEALLLAIQPHQPHDGDILFDLANTRSMAGDLDESLRYLRASIEAGYRNWQNMETVPSLRNLRTDPRFSALLGEYRR